MNRFTEFVISILINEALKDRTRFSPSELRLIDAELEKLNPQELSYVLKISYDDVDLEIALTKLREQVKINSESLTKIHELAFDMSIGNTDISKINEIKSELELVEETFENNDEFINYQDLMTKDYPEIIYKSGIAGLDKIVGEDGFINENLYVFASKAKGGKSIVLQNIAIRIAKNNPEQKVLYLSLENTEKNIRDRQKYGFVNFGDINNVFFKYDYKASITKINEYANNFDILIIDYLGRIFPEKDYKNTYDMYGDFTDQLHLLAINKHKLIITACQLNRATMSVFTNKEQTFRENFLDIDQDKIGDSIKIVQNADCVITTIQYPNETDGISKNAQLFNNIACRFRTAEDSCAIYYSTQYKLQLETGIRNSF